MRPEWRQRFDNAVVAILVAFGIVLAVSMYVEATK